MQRTFDNTFDLWRSAAALFTAALVGLAAFMLSLRVAEATKKVWAISAVVLLFPVLLTIYRRPKEILLFGWIFALTYNRQYFSFDAVFGSHGSQGVYWIVSDVFLIGLAVFWAYEAIVLKKTNSLQGRPFWPWYVPFVVACLISIVGAEKPVWSFHELLRFLRFSFIIWYCRCNLGRREWWVCVLALCSAMAAQSAVGLKEIVTGRSGVLGLEQAATGIGQFEDVFSQESFYGSVRATGTMNHPPNLACYILQVLPIALALALAAPNGLIRIVSLAFAAAGVIGLACTLSRWPWALAVGQLAVLFIGLVALRQMSLKQALGVASVLIAAGGLCLVPLRDKIVQRFTGDFSASVDQRKESTEIALRMFLDHPITGIGLNNSAYHLPKYFPDIEWAVENDAFLVQQVRTRALAIVGNGFLYVLVEFGVIGCIGFLIYLAGVLVCGLRGLTVKLISVRLACLGMFVGILGVLGQQVVDFSYWVDPLLYTFALVVGLCNVAPTLFAVHLAPMRHGSIDLEEAR